ncbi:MAG: Rieske 2Fe-2S domain-containing protein [Beijerinckiaceae bacterium]|nr:Rieske 2Fe-2S domain-containing protein [Beijerinckiaceae bacterium]
MLSHQDNEALCRVGPGSLMGNLMREFWMPALISRELPEPDGAPVRLRLLGENLVAFRDTAGKVGIVDALCPHRRAGMFFGRNEEHGLRCIYHGWKFDVTGRCMDLPTEPSDNGMRERISIKSYPARERGGVVWVYMGKKANPPELPDFEWARVPDAQRTLTKRVQYTNWAQAVEGGIDSAHVSHLHSHRTKAATGVNFQDTAEAWKYLEADKHPIFEVDEAETGLLIKARRNADENYYWRVTQFLLPFYTLTPPTVDPRQSEDAAYYGHAWVPIDDETTWTWTFHADPKRAFSQGERDLFEGDDGFWGPIDAEYKPIMSMQNNFGIDREKQRHETYSGIDGIQNQDAAVQESMGAIVNRTEEHLGHSDLAVVRFRRLLLKLARELADGGAIDAPAPAFNKRPLTVLLPREMDVSQMSNSLIALDR